MVTRSHRNSTTRLHPQTPGGFFSWQSDGAQGTWTLIVILLPQQLWLFNMTFSPQVRVRKCSVCWMGGCLSHSNRRGLSVLQLPQKGLTQISTLPTNPLLRPAGQGLCLSPSIQAVFVRERYLDFVHVYLLFICIFSFHFLGFMFSELINDEHLHKPLIGFALLPFFYDSVDTCLF